MPSPWLQSAQQASFGSTAPLFTLPTEGLDIFSQGNCPRRTLLTLERLFEHLCTSWLIRSVVKKKKQPKMSRDRATVADLNILTEKSKTVFNGGNFCPAALI